MIAAELRGGNKPSLNEALGWIGSRVDDIYGASVGRLEDVWIDPGTGVPRWLLVKEGRFGGRTTLIPFEDATAGAGHVWVPYEREIVRDAPEIEPGAPLTQQVEAALRSHYAANVPAAISHGTQQAEPSGPSTQAPATATIHFATGGAEKEEPVAPEPEVPRRAVLREQPPLSRVRGVIPPLPPRPAPPTPVPTSEPYSAYPPQPEPQPTQQQRPGWQMPVEPPVPQQQFQPPQPQQFQPPQPQQYQPPQYQQPPPPQQYQPPAQWQQQQQQPQAQPPQGPPPPPSPPTQAQQQPLPANPYEALAALGRSSQSHYVEIELSGELSIRGELRSVRVIPRDSNA